MNHLISKLFFMLVLPLFALQVQAQNEKYYGEKITTDKAVASKKVAKLLEGKETVQTKVEGKIVQTCSKKGCWMTMDIGNGQKMLVKFKDYGFFVPKNGMEGKTTIIEGVAKKEIIDVATLQHYAEDAGKSKEEINKINAPEEKYTFEAVGVIIK